MPSTVVNLCGSVLVELYTLENRKYESRSAYVHQIQGQNGFIIAATSNTVHTVHI